MLYSSKSTFLTFSSQIPTNSVNLTKFLPFPYMRNIEYLRGTTIFLLWGMAKLLRFSVVYYEILTKFCEEFSYGMSFVSSKIWYIAIVMVSALLCYKGHCYCYAIIIVIIIDTCMLSLYMYILCVRKLSEIRLWWYKHWYAIFSKLVSVNPGRFHVMYIHFHICFLYNCV